MPVESLELETNSYMVQGTRFDMDKRYQIVSAMSHGAYGVVCSAHDLAMDEPIAIKKIENVFEHITITKRTLRELRILRHLKHENLMQVKNLLVAGPKAEFDEIYVISELMETDLASTLRSSQDLTEEHCQFFFYQILRGLKYVHSAGVIHRDLKPRNLLVNSNCDLKICDFGLARVRFADKQWVCPMTEYVCTRWYRAPEVLCSWTDYSAAIDMWSVGCILVELFTRRPLFPGQNTQQQLDLIIKCMGSPSGEELLKIFNVKCRKFIGSLPRTIGLPFQVVFPEISASAQDLLQLILMWDPERRVNVFDAIQHPFVQNLHCPEDEPTRDPLDTTDFEFERRKITAAALREEIFREAILYHPSVLARFNEEYSAGCDPHDIKSYRLLNPGESAYSSDEDDDDEVDEGN